MNEVTLVSITQPVNLAGIHTASDFISYVARVSNPNNQTNLETAGKLLSYLVKNKHWSPFELVHIGMEIKTTRDIGRQILRHRSFSFQEFSQRYAAVMAPMQYREARMQDAKNRQNSLALDNTEEANDIKALWEHYQATVMSMSSRAYEWAIKAGIAKEQARAVLPEGMTPSTMYMVGSLRSWMHYCWLRMGNGTQLEHQDIARKCFDILAKEFEFLREMNDG